jgi:hypothetical protein
MDPEKLIFWLMRWGWRGPAALALVIFCIWLYSRWTYYRGRDPVTATWF